MPWLSSEHINSGPSSSLPSPQCCRLAHSWWCEYVDLSTTAFILAVIALLGFCGLILSEFFFFSCVYRFDLCLFSVVLGLFYIFFLLNCTSFLEPWFLSLKMITWAKDGWVWASDWSAGELAWGTVQCWVWENDVLTIAVLLLICFWAKLSALGKQKEWNAVLKCKDSEESSCTSSHQCSNRDLLTWTPRFPLNSCWFILLITPSLNFRQSPVSAMSAASTWTACTLASTASSLAVSPRNTSMTMQSPSGTTWVRHSPAAGLEQALALVARCLSKKPTVMKESLWNWALKWTLAFIWDLLNWCYSLTVGFLGFQ